MKLPSTHRKKITFRGIPDDTKGLDALINIALNHPLMATLILKHYDQNTQEKMLASFIKQSEELLTQEKMYQAQILQSYPANVQNLLNTFFARINRESIEYQKNTYRNALHYFKAGVLPNDGLHGIGDNCYEYATGNIFDSSKIDVFHNPGYSMVVPGYWCLIDENKKTVFRKDINKYFSQDEITTFINIRPTVLSAQSNGYPLSSDWCSMIKFDAKFAGKRLTKLPAFNRDTYVSKPNTTLFAGVYCAEDYHFYRFNPEVGLWTHKRGATPVAATDDSGNLIFDPFSCNRGMYTEFMGYFELS